MSRSCATRTIAVVFALWATMADAHASRPWQVGVGLRNAPGGGIDDPGLVDGVRAGVRWERPQHAWRFESTVSGGRRLTRDSLSVETIGSARVAHDLAHNLLLYDPDRGDPGMSLDRDVATLQLLADWGFGRAFLQDTAPAFRPGLVVGVESRVVRRHIVEWQPETVSIRLREDHLRWQVAMPVLGVGVELPTGEHTTIRLSIMRRYGIEPAPWVISRAIAGTSTVIAADQLLTLDLWWRP